MKIALCISGQPRGLPTSCEFLLNNIVYPNKSVDVFIHTWYDNSIVGKSFDSAQPGKTNSLGSWIDGTDTMLRTMLSPIAIKIEPPNDFKQFSHLSNRESAIQTSLASMFYSAYMSNNLKCEYERSSGVIYDVVIKTRFDINYYSPVIIQNIIDDKIKTHAYVPAMYQHMRQNDSYPTKSGLVYSSMSDTFIIASSENMNKITSVYVEFEKHHAEIWPYVYGEAYLGYVVRGIHQIPIEMKDIKYTLYR